MNSQSIKIIFGPSNGGMIIPSSHHIYWRLSDFRQAKKYSDVTHSWASAGPNCIIRRLCHIIFLLRQITNQTVPSLHERYQKTILQCWFFWKNEACAKCERHKWFGYCPSLNVWISLTHFMKTPWQRYIHASRVVGSGGPWVVPVFPHIYFGYLNQGGGGRLCPPHYFRTPPRIFRPSYGLASRVSVCVIHSTQQF